MRTRTRFTLTTLSFAALTAVLAAGPSDPGAPSLLAPAFAQELKPEEFAADWEKSVKSALNESGKKYEGLYKWCLEKKLAFTAINVRRLVLRYDPENEEVRKFVGYMKTPDGLWLRNDARRDAIREEADIEDPKAQKFPEKLESTNKAVIDVWKRLGTKATKYGGIDKANAEDWKTKGAIAWERVLQVNSENEQAHKELGHPKFGGKYVRPEAVPFLKTRDERKQGGQKRANMPFKAEVQDLDGLFKAANLTGGAAKSEHVVINTVHGKDVAVRLAIWAERTMEDFVQIYGVDPDVKNRISINRLDVVKEKPELEAISRAGGWEAARIQEFSKYFGGWQVQAGQFVSTCSAGEDADDSTIHRIGHGLGDALRNMAIQEFGSPSPSMEDWLQEVIAYDMSRRLKGTVLTQCGQFGKYGMDMAPRIDKDIWIDMARRLVEYDDDVPLSQLWRKTLQDQNLRGPEKVKGYAFVQFLFESDVEKARTFMKIAAAQGTPRATLAVYGEGDGGGGDEGGGEGGGAASDPSGGMTIANAAMDALDAKYRDWIIKSW